MSARIRLVLLALVAALAGPAAAQAPSTPAPPLGPAPPQTTPREAPVIFGLRFPDTVAGFPRGNVIDFEKDHAGLGYDVKYGGSGWIVDVFIYDAGLKDIPDSLAAERVGRQFAQPRGDIFRRQQLGSLTVEETGTFRISAPDKIERFVCGAYLIVENARQIDSFLCLATWKGKFVKYRLSTLRRAGSAGVARRFVSGWIDVLWPAPGPRRPL